MCFYVRLYILSRTTCEAIDFQFVKDRFGKELRAQDIMSKNLIYVLLKNKSRRRNGNRKYTDNIGILDFKLLIVCHSVCLLALIKYVQSKLEDR